MLGSGDVFLRAVYSVFRRMISLLQTTQPEPYMSTTNSCLRRWNLPSKGGTRLTTPKCGREPTGTHSEVHGFFFSVCNRFLLSAGCRAFQEEAEEIHPSQHESFCLTLYPPHPTSCRMNMNFTAWAVRLMTGSFRASWRCKVGINQGGTRLCCILRTGWRRFHQHGVFGNLEAHWNIELRSPWPMNANILNQFNLECNKKSGLEFQVWKYYSN